MKRKWSLNNSIKSQIIISFIVVILFIGILLAGVVTIQISMSNELNDLHDANSNILSLNEDVHSLKTLTEQYLSTKTTEALEGIHDIMNALNLTIYEMKTTPPSSQINMKIRDIGYLTEGLVNHVNIALRAKMDANIDEYTENFERIGLLTEYVDTQCAAVNALMAEENILVIQRHDERQFQFYQIAVLFILLVAIECSVYIVVSTRAIADPIIEMADHAKALAQGNFDVDDIVYKSHDEVAALATTFNQMKSDIRKNIYKMEQQQQLELELVEKESENYRIELMLQDAQLVAMQSQIQPHFLFNTINAGLQIAYSESADKTMEYFNQMSDLLRYSLQNFWEPVPLRSEIEQIYRYFHIMRTRFGNCITFQVIENLDETVQNQLMVPCMILQPLVENCYAHGVKDQQRPGEITVVLGTYQGRYVVRIIDNGKGMSSEMVEHLLDMHADTGRNVRDTHRGLGVRNVIGRLRNYYKREDVIEIYSEEGNGTEIILMLEEESHETVRRG